MGYSYAQRNKDNRLLVLLYHWALFGIIFAPIAIQIELLGRICSPFVIMKFLFMAVLLYDILINKTQVKKYVLFLSIFIFAYYVFTKVVTYPLSLDKNLTYYIWDSKGRNTQYITNDK